MISARAASACESGLWASGATCPPMGLCGSLSSDGPLRQLVLRRRLSVKIWMHPEPLLRPLEPLGTSSTSEVICTHLSTNDLRGRGQRGRGQEVEVRSPAVYSPILLMIPSALTPGCVRYNLQICSARSLSISRDAAISLTVLPLLANRMTFSISPV